MAGLLLDESKIESAFDMLADVADQRSLVENAVFLEFARSRACWVLCCCQNVDDEEDVSTNFPWAVMLPRDRSGELPNSFEASLAAISRSMASL